MQHITKQRHHFANKSPYTQSCGFSSSHIWMWELDHKEGWALKNWCFQAVGLEKTLGSPLDSKGIKWVNPKGNQPWLFIGEGNGNPLQCSCLENPRDGGAWWAAVYGVAQSRTRLKRLSSSSTSSIHWKDWCWSWSSNTRTTWCEELTLWKRPWCWEGLRAEEKGTTEDEMIGWHHWLDGHGFGSTPGVGDGQGGLACCSSWGRKESDMTEWLNWTDGSSIFSFFRNLHIFSIMAAPTYFTTV